jgi:hypothetical protein
MGSSAHPSPTITFNRFFNVESDQFDLEQYLIESATVNHDQLMVAKKIQLRQEGPLLVILLQLSFIDLQQFSQLLDWTIKIRRQKN